MNQNIIANAEQLKFPLIPILDYKTWKISTYYKTHLQTLKSSICIRFK